MNAEAERVHIHWRRRLFGFHVLMLVLVRLAVGSIDQMPPPEIYSWISTWGFIVFGHGLLLAILDGYDQADLPAWLSRFVYPRERRWSLFVIDAVLWILATMAIASRAIPYSTIERYANPLALAWLALTGVGLVHMLLVLYAEIRDYRARHKPKNDQSRRPVDGRLLSDDGELISDHQIGDSLIDFAFPDDVDQRKHDRR